MSTKRRFTIGGVVAAILVLIGMGVFLAYDINVPVQEVRVYELPSPIVPSVEEVHGTTGTTVASATGQQGRNSGNTTIQYSVESDQGYEDTAASGESAIEPCCPEEVDQSPTGDIGFGQDTNLDRNPVSPELIKDTRRYWEYVEARNKYNERYDALREKQRQLERELVSLNPVLVKRMQETYPGIKFQSHLTQAERLTKLEALGPRMEFLRIEIKELRQQRPVAPIPTHRH